MFSGSSTASDELPASCGSASTRTLVEGAVVAEDLVECRLAFFERVMFYAMIGVAAEVDAQDTDSSSSQPFLFKQHKRTMRNLEA